jgi:transposase
VARAYIGVDVSKLTLDVTFIIENQKNSSYKVFKNNTQGFEDFCGYLDTLKVEAHICLESTGIYGKDFTDFVYKKGLKVSVVNPCLIKSFAQSEGKRAKTDKVDSAVIARFCRSHNPKLWHPQTEFRQQLQALNRCLEALINDKTKLLNRIEGSKNKAVIKVWEQSIQNIEEQMVDVQNQIKELIDKNPDLKGDIDLLTSITGVGTKTAITVLSELPDVKDFKNAKEVAAFAGLIPQTRQSGTSVKGRGSLCKMGNRNLRKAMYMPTLSAKRFNPVLSKFCDNLAQKGKNSMVVVVAGMRKLLHIIFGVLKSKQPFNKHKYIF